MYVWAFKAFNWLLFFISSLSAFSQLRSASLAYIFNKLAFHFGHETSLWIINFNTVSNIQQQQQHHQQHWTFKNCSKHTVMLLCFSYNLKSVCYTYSRNWVENMSLSRITGNMLASPPQWHWKCRFWTLYSNWVRVSGSTIWWHCVCVFVFPLLKDFQAWNSLKCALLTCAVHYCLSDWDNFEGTREYEIEKEREKKNSSHSYHKC